MEGALATWKELPLTYRVGTFVAASILLIALIYRAVARKRPCPPPPPPAAPPTAMDRGTAYATPVRGIR